MPGILPMKVIKIGSNSQSRIAQACDRCRSKKIRCDGVTPCCSQCKAVGFECKTSDKLSRRAFPRGYTETLEERVRSLESEVKDFKELLDEKDEKIEVLSKIHAFSSPNRQNIPLTPSKGLSSSPMSPRMTEMKSEDEDVLVQPMLQLLQLDEKSDPIFSGQSSTATFAGVVISTIREQGFEEGSLSAETFAVSSQDDAAPASFNRSHGPSRIVLDQLVNIYFQEWAPLFPVLSRTDFLPLYQEFINQPNSQVNSITTAQLHLVFGVATLASQSNSELTPYFERQWTLALVSMLNEESLATMQCLVLAQLYCMTKGDHHLLLRYTGLAVTLANRLGLSQSQDQFELSPQSKEVRKRLFWSLYVLDCFTAATLGLPKLLRDDEVSCELPVDLDDERLAQQRTPSRNEATKTSSAKALIQASRILSKVLRNLNQKKAQSTSKHTVALLEEELRQWREGLPDHLRLDFSKDKPSTKVISSRCPILALVYYYIRILIHRLVLISPSRTATPSSSIVAIADSSKHIVQVIELLNERSMSFTMCLSKTELLSIAGLGLLLQAVDLKGQSKLLKDDTRLIKGIIAQLEKRDQKMAKNFKLLASSVIKSKFGPELPPSQAERPVIQEPNSGSKPQIKSFASRLSFTGFKANRQQHRLTHRNPGSMPAPTSIKVEFYDSQGGSQSSPASVATEPAVERRPLSQLHGLQPNAFGTVDYLPLDPTYGIDGDVSPAPMNTEWNFLTNIADPYDLGSPMPLGEVASDPSPDRGSMTTVSGLQSSRWTPDSEPAFAQCSLGTQPFSPASADCAMVPPLGDEPTFMDYPVMMGNNNFFAMNQV